MHRGTGDEHVLGEPFLGARGYAGLSHELRHTRVPFAVERARGFVEAPDSRPDDPTGLRLQRPSPDGRYTLRLWYLFERRQALQTASGEPIEFADVVWADWTPRNQLLVATRDGRIQIQELDRARRRTVSEHLLDKPLEFKPAPDRAREW